jgi:RNase H-fold protein (predicted Holliday junction resolvase)
LSNSNEQDSIRKAFHQKFTFCIDSIVIAIIIMEKHKEEKKQASNNHTNNKQDGDDNHALMMLPSSVVGLEWGPLPLVDTVAGSPSSPMFASTAATVSNSSAAPSSSSKTVWKRLFEHGPVRQQVVVKIAHHLLSACCSLTSEEDNSSSSSSSSLRHASMLSTTVLQQEQQQQEHILFILPHLSKLLERALYMDAASLHEYRNEQTLIQRLLNANLSSGLAAATSTSTTLATVSNNIAAFSLPPLLNWMRAALVKKYNNMANQPQQQTLSPIPNHSKPTGEQLVQASHLQPAEQQTRPSIPSVLLKEQQVSRPVQPMTTATSRKRLSEQLQLSPTVIQSAHEPSNQPPPQPQKKPRVRPVPTGPTPVPTMSLQNNKKQPPLRLPTAAPTRPNQKQSSLASSSGEAATTGAALQQPAQNLCLLNTKQPPLRLPPVAAPTRPNQKQSYLASSSGVAASALLSLASSPGAAASALVVAAETTLHSQSLSVEPLQQQEEHDQQLTGLFLSKFSRQKLTQALFDTLVKDGHPSDDPQWNQELLEWATHVEEECYQSAQSQAEYTKGIQRYLRQYRIQCLVSKPESMAGTDYDNLPDDRQKMVHEILELLADELLPTRSSPFKLEDYMVKAMVIEERLHTTTAESNEQSFDAAAKKRRIEQVIAELAISSDEAIAVVGQPVPPPPPPFPPNQNKNSLALSPRAADSAVVATESALQHSIHVESEDILSGIDDCRQQMIRDIIHLLLHTLEPSPPIKDILKRAKFFEEQLYTSAESKEEYSDATTLKDRLKRLGAGVPVVPVATTDATEQSLDTLQRDYKAKTLVNLLHNDLAALHPKYRKKMIFDIIRLVVKTEKTESSSHSDHQDMAERVKFLERRLYESAKSKQEYTAADTLPDRLKRITITTTMEAAADTTNDIPQSAAASSSKTSTNVVVVANPAMQNTNTKFAASCTTTNNRTNSALARSSKTSTNSIVAAKSAVQKTNTKFATAGATNKISTHSALAGSSKTSTNVVVVAKPAVQKTNTKFAAAFTTNNISTQSTAAVSRKSINVVAAANPAVKDDTKLEPISHYDREMMINQLNTLFLHADTFGRGSETATPKQKRNILAKARYFEKRLYAAAKSKPDYVAEDTLKDRLERHAIDIAQAAIAKQQQLRSFSSSSASGESTTKLSMMNNSSSTSNAIIKSTNPHAVVVDLSMDDDDDDDDDSPFTTVLDSPAAAPDNNSSHRYKVSSVSNTNFLANPATTAAATIKTTATTTSATTNTASTRSSSPTSQQHADSASTTEAATTATSTTSIASPQCSPTSQQHAEK